MKKLFAFALTVLIVAVAVPAMADVDVTATITKTKDITVAETLDKTKNVSIEVGSTLIPAGAAEVEAIVNVRNIDNFVGPNGELTPQLTREARLLDSVVGNSGILGLNQDVGSMVNQANVVSFGLTASETAFTEAQAAVDHVNTGNEVDRQEEVLNLDSPNPLAVIGGEGGSISGNSGIVGVNQNAGNMNSQTNAIALAVGAGARAALSEADLGQVNAGNTVCEVNTFKADRLLNSINGNSGIVSVNQSAGNMNNQAAVVSFAALTSSVTLPAVGQ